MADIEYLQSLMRKVEDTDKGKILSVSYSKLSILKNCPLQYKLKYIDQNFSQLSDLPMEIGTIFHKVLELKGHYLIKKEAVDYQYLKTTLYSGFDEENLRTKKVNHVSGLKELKSKYWESYNNKDNATGMTYTEKETIFINDVLPTVMENDDWTPFMFEYPFEFVYNTGDREIILHGMIDRIDIRVINGETEYRVVDYKSSKKIYRDGDLPTALQLFIYGLAIVHDFGVLPVEYLYYFILINQTQKAMTKGYEKRGILALNKLIGLETKCKCDSVYQASPTPLCYWCSFHGDSPNADPKFKGKCQSYSLWTPTNKTFQTFDNANQNNNFTQNKNTNDTSKRKFTW